MNAGRGGHHGSRGPKISYPTRDAAQVAAWRRSVELGRPMYAYQCKLKGRPEHFHIAPGGWWNRHEKGRLMEQARTEIGERAAACLIVENYGEPAERGEHLAKRLSSASKRRSRVWLPRLA